LGTSVRYLSSAVAYGSPLSRGRPGTLLPLRQLALNRLDQLQRLVGHDVVIRIRDHDHRRILRDVRRKLVHELARDEAGALAADHRNRALRRAQILVGIAVQKAHPEVRVEPPGPADAAVGAAKLTE